MRSALAREILGALEGVAHSPYYGSAKSPQGSPPYGGNPAAS